MIKGDVAIIYLMLNFIKNKKIFCLNEVVSRYNLTEKGVWSRLDAKEQEKRNRYYFLNLMKMVSFDYKIKIVISKIIKTLKKFYNII